VSTMFSLTLREIVIKVCRQLPSCHPRRVYMIFRRYFSTFVHSGWDFSTIQFLLLSFALSFRSRLL
jgi:hypothetical protein